MKRPSPTSRLVMEVGTRCIGGREVFEFLGFG